MINQENTERNISAADNCCSDRHLGAETYTIRVKEPIDKTKRARLSIEDNNGTKNSPNSLAMIKLASKGYKNSLMEEQTALDTNNALNQIMQTKPKKRIGCCFFCC